jgi:hypothetical protein
MSEFDLEHRAARCAAWARAGNPVALVINESERAEAVRLIGDAPVIVARGDEIMMFIRNYGKRINARRF